MGPYSDCRLHWRFVSWRIYVDTVDVPGEDITTFGRRLHLDWPGKSDVWLLFHLELARDSDAGLWT